MHKLPITVHGFINEDLYFRIRKPRQNTHNTESRDVIEDQVVGISKRCNLMRY